jgi:class 3 adenylate cyclase
MTRLPPGKLIPVSLMAIDAAGHSKVVLGLAKKMAHQVFGELEGRVAREVESNDGHLLGWAGDGGIALFTVADHLDDETRARKALASAENIASWMPNFNDRQGLDPDHTVGVRIALHSGQLVWNKQRGSIHSSDVNFVAHLEHALPVGTIAASREFVNCLPNHDRSFFIEAGKFEEHEILLFAKNPEKRDESLRSFASKQKLKTLAEACQRYGLEYFGFRRLDAPVLPTALYESAKSDILIVGLSLASTFHHEGKNPVLEALRAASKRKVAIHLMVLDPASIGKEFAEGIHSINRTIQRLTAEVNSGRLDQAHTFLRKLPIWPHFTGFMIDGDVRSSAGDVTALVAAGRHPIVRIQATIAPESDRSQHFAPLFQFASSGRDSDAIDAYIRGFRHYWHMAEAHSFAGPVPIPSGP